MNGLNSKYNYTFGVLSALGIIFVVFGHTGANLLTLEGWFSYYSFHIQLFLFISGYFFHCETVNNVGNYVVKKAKRLLLPFYMWNFVYLLFQTLLNHLPAMSDAGTFHLGNNFSLYNLFLQPWVCDQPIGFNASTWFVIALFIVEIYNILLQWLCKKLRIENDWIILGLSLIIALMGIGMIHSGATGVLKVASRSMYCLWFYRLGYWYKAIGEKIDTMNSTVYFIVLFFIQAVFRIKYEDLTMGVFECSNFQHLPVILIEPFIGILFWLRVAKVLTPLLKNVEWFVFIGKNTMPIMTHHLAALFMVKTVMYVLYLRTSLFSTFDVVRYLNEVYYLWIPNDTIKQIYGVVSIVMVLSVVYIMQYIKRKHIK